MKKFILLITLLFSGTMFCEAQQNLEDTAYILFDSSSGETCKIDVEGEGYQKVNKFRKEDSRKEFILFHVCDEIFLASKRQELDTLNNNSLKKIKLRDIQYLNNVREEFKSTYFFKKDVFDKIYLLEQNKNKILKYEVVWATDLVLN